MERGFLSLLNAGKSALADEDFSLAPNSDDESMTRIMSFQPLNYEKSMISMLHYSPYAPSFDILDGDFRSKKISDQWPKEDSKWRSTAEREEKLKMLKNEPSIEPICYSPTILFGQLPELQSMEQLNHEEKRLKLSLFSPVATTTANQQILEPTLTNLDQLIRSNYFTPTPLQRILPPFPSPAKLSPTETARRRRNTLSDKARSLHKVLPWDKKMDMATVYEETFKYVKFLEAQIAALESMPVIASTASSSGSNFGSENPRFCNPYGELGKLNRQQLLEVLVNSFAAQTILYSKGCCIYSLEQLILFKDIAEKNFFFSDPFNQSFSRYFHFSMIN
ncbi:hypothetical protein OSB04_021721 [Centaurea solstitialis]|uniref:BHLH domain-containing protein n=1 Tax=Centaurea solstitialis TaxID=347529 RepID=A0AA38SV09_9ASTR|nr:hypothetical protein OSB04_021721 [Centaurea solstitialis]